MTLLNKKDELVMEFLISKKSRDFYKFDETLFSISGNVIFANFHAVRRFVQKMNEKRDLIRYPEKTVKAGDVNAMGLIDEILHFIIDLYREQKNQSLMKEAFEWIYKKIGKKKVDASLLQFVEGFPPVAVYRGEITSEKYLDKETNGVPNRYIALEEMLMLWLANVNPAFSPYLELFDDTSLEKFTEYKQIVSSLHKFFNTQPGFSPREENLFDMLRSPAVARPHSLSGQLDYIREHWGFLLGRYVYRLLDSLDLIQEEQKQGFTGHGPTKVYEFGESESEPERFSKDLDWMPQVVMLAKNAYVWLDQLSEQYQYEIKRLDQIPDKELDTLAKQGFTALWLIGLWERSKASKRIKRLCGNPEAEASAYSLFDYVIASDLGGEDAFQDLRNRAWRRGIRVAGDMVPNHVGIDGKWVFEHPDWFISLDHSPYPSYTFSGPNLSWDEHTGIFLEDHYYDRTDAAVVFKHIDFRTNRERYIYHGNDGTSMPWNDTAQINFLNPEAREAVIQAILHVARKFPVIRFDAAMTLVKRHIQRLWFPEPGTGGAIPSRAGHGMTQEQIDQLMPQEFWREVVDRIAEEAPDTLLLAEAFWMLEGYFVRTLGMHRVYNSAFMNMLKQEENAKYRTVMKNTLEFNPEILKRFVNFMNNPDEETAVAQFGKDDKYFGVCIMMVTLPGLPMFGHGQVEGFTEKYGMEFRRSYWNEQPDAQLIDRHEREIFPLLRRRYIFSEVENFLLYDFFSSEGRVDENVFAYTNRFNNEKALIVYHNTFAQTSGWIRTSVAYSVKTDGGDERKIIHKNIGEGLDLQNNKTTFTIFRDHISKLEYIRNNQELYDKGIYIELDAFKYHIFLDFREVQDDNRGRYCQITDFLNGRGVPSIEEASRELFLKPIHKPFRELINTDTFQTLFRARTPQAENEPDPELIDELSVKILFLLKEIKKIIGSSGDESTVEREIRYKLLSVLQILSLKNQVKKNKSKTILKRIEKFLNDNPQYWACVISWVFIHAIGKIAEVKSYKEQSRSWIDEWRLGKVITEAVENLRTDKTNSQKLIQIIKILTAHQRWFDPHESKSLNPSYILENLLNDNDVQQFLGINRYQSILWFQKERYEELLNWLLIIAVIDAASDTDRSTSEIENLIWDRYSAVEILQNAEKKSEYRVEKLLREVEKNTNYNNRKNVNK